MARPAGQAWWRTRLVGVAALIGSLALGAGCNAAGATAQWRAGAAAPPPAGHLVIIPPADATNVSPADPVRVAVSNGSLESVAVTNPAGKVVKGEFDLNQQTWLSAEPLGYNKTYTIVATAVGGDGQRIEHTQRFTTVKPKEFTLPYLRANLGTLLDGGTFGVGQPIVVWFDEPITDKAAAERTLSVTTDPPVLGAWHWLKGSNREAHWRPKEYWPAGTQVTVEAKVYGRHLGGGLYGQEDRKASFKIGSKKVAIADSTTKRMKVYIDDKQVTTINGRDVTAGIPISMGKTGTEIGANGQLVDWRTYSGPHVVTLKYEVYRMTSASFGITDPNSPNFYDVKIKKSIRISASGEFVHLADWNIPAHGKYNTSHGCINVAPAYIYWFYDTFGAGDVVDVRNTGKQLDYRDGLGDWVLSWEQWLAGSALN